jgi:hypothetical protein
MGFPQKMSKITNIIASSDNSESTNIVAQDVTDVVPNNSIPCKLTAPLTGKAAFLAQVDVLGYKSHGSMVVKPRGKTQAPIHIFFDGDNISAVTTKAVKKDSGEYLLVENQNTKIWVPKQKYSDGFEYLTELSKNNEIFNIVNLQKAGIDDDVSGLTEEQIQGLVKEKGTGTRVVDTLGANALFFECDKGSFESQWKNIQFFAKTKGLKPSLVINSGGKSLHVYYKLSETVTDMDLWQETQRKLIILFSSDTQIQNLNREMRLAGFNRCNTGNEQSVEFYENNEMSLEEIIEKISGSFPFGVSGDRWKEYHKLRDKKIVTPTRLSALLNKPESSYKTVQREDLRKYEPNTLPGNSQILRLYDFLGNDNKKLVENGLVQGTSGREPQLGKLIGRLVTIANDLNRLGITHDNDIEGIALTYAANCSPALHQSEVTRHLAKARMQDKTTDDSYYISRAKWILKGNPEELAKLEVKFAEVPKESTEKDKKQLPEGLPWIPEYVFMTESQIQYFRDKTLSVENRLFHLKESIFSQNLQKLYEKYNLRKRSFEVDDSQDVSRKCFIAEQERFEYKPDDIYFLEEALDFLSNYRPEITEEIAEELGEDHRWFDPCRNPEPKILLEAIEIIKSRIGEISKQTNKKVYSDLTQINFEKCQELGVKVTRINKEFLSSSDLNLQQNKITILASPKGTGKTKTLGQAIDQNDFQGIASWHTRISLCAKMATDIGIVYKPGSLSNKQSFCSNSAYKFNPANLVTRGLLICDEFDQIMQYNFESLCNKDGMRPTILRYFEAHLYAALNDGSALFMSEDISQKEIDFLQKIAPIGIEIELIVNDFKPKRGVLKFSTDKDCTGVLEDLLKKIEKKIPCFVVDDLKDGVFGGKSISQYLLENFPEINLKVINSETSASLVDFIANINHESKLVDVIVCSPSITAGVSLENTRFKNGVYLFANGIFDANAASQSIARVRGAEEINVWVADKGFNFEQSYKTTPEKVNEFYQEIETKRTSILENFNVFYDPIRSEFSSPYWELYCQNAATRNIAMSDLKNKVKAKLIHDGYQLEEVKFSTSKETQEALRNSWGTLKLEKIKAIEKTELPSLEEIKTIRLKLESQTSLTETEQLKLIKNQIHNTFGGELISKSVSQFGEENLTGYASMAYLNWSGDLEKSCYKFFNAFHRTVLDNIERDLRIDEAQSYLGTRFPGDIRFSMIEFELFSRLNLKEFADPNKKFLDSDCEEIYMNLRLEFSSEPNHWIHKTKPAAAIANILRDLGVNFKKTADGKAPKITVNGKRVRVYQPDEQTLQFLAEFSEYRLSKNKPAFEIEDPEHVLNSDFAVLDTEKSQYIPSERLEKIEKSHIEADLVMLQLRNDAFGHTEIVTEYEKEFSEKIVKTEQVSLF